MYLTWQAQLFGITKTRAFLMAFLLCCVVLLFPWALRAGLTVWWVLSVIFLVIIGTLCPSRQMDMDKSKNNLMAMTCDPKVSEENNANQELIDQTLPVEEYIPKTEEGTKIVGDPEGDNELVGETEEDKELVEETKEDIVGNDTISVTYTVDHILISNEFPGGLDNVLCLEELIDLGFKAKHTAKFEQAAFYFSRALALKPTPDIAFYLILDCYWLWSNLGERKYALTQLDEYIKTYLPQFNSEHRHQFKAWMAREDIHKN